ncbi:hypothetical protein PF005_g30293 [Phytophthora fragariae]|uniref:Uncharacterized protein n=3 Tax=Phytophthora fragariae TaxID=53985 RepID=A0A6A3WTK7_9STRA|nr:hypothetical protein PF009_g28590 [Phytophthora fragariae]KAE9077546.1 hypothetical protein PF007_g24201 [Phytophthora fragariae]KAE9163799.1 hypothetical protein PF005_g30293 [Phytophthora fragariae]KAE9189173.1 hypothetical protein PF002_g25117 [Phytophthora fragariae]
MITRGTTDQASPSSPSSRADSAPTDRDPPPAAAAVAPPDVVDVTGTGEPWTTAPARRTTEAAPLRTSKRATPKAVPGEAPADASKARKKATASAKAKPAKAAAAAKRLSAPPRSDGGFDLHEFMASFSPGTTREDIAAPEERAAPEETPMAQVSTSSEGVATQHDPAVGDQVQALQAEVERLRALVAGQRLAQIPLGSIPFLHANPSAPTAPNIKGELPPAEVRYLTTASFPEGAKRAKGDYNPPQAHLLAASRMFRAFGTETGKPLSAMSFVLWLRELEAPSRNRRASGKFSAKASVFLISQLRPTPIHPVCWAVERTVL